ncbi:DUF2332 domain-containing protein [Pseudolysinimonas kribbensis]
MEYSVATYYRTFAEVEAHGTSPLYEDWALGVATEPDLLALIAALPRPKQQANLIFASARMIGVPERPFSEVRDMFVAEWEAISAIASSHATQTNEAARCGTLLPTIAQIEGPVALIEVRASAGLRLLPDRYSYELVDGAGSRARLDPIDGPSEALLRCELLGEPFPTRMPEIIWRAGIDLHPLDPRDTDAITWLETLIWPEHDDRRTVLRAAAGIAAREMPRVVPGDLLAELPRVAAEAPDDATLVVFHSAVLAYLDAEQRADFRRLVTGIPAIWIANEGSGVTPGVAERLRPGAVRRGEFVVAVDGIPVAAASPHGRYRRAL